jgi:hypothetical protein
MEYNLNIKQLRVAKELDNKQDFVVEVDWEYMASEGSATCARYGTASFSQPGDSFIPFDDLTEDIVKSWVVSLVDIAKLQASLSEQINDILDPKVSVVPFPWNS